MNSKHKQYGFTIVELLIVIVGIAGTQDTAGLTEYFNTVSPWMSPSVVEQAVSETPKPTQLSSFVASLDCKFGSGQYPVTDTAPCPDVVPKPGNLYGNLPSVC